MTRISGSLSGVDLTALNNLNAAFAQISEAGLKLSTLRRINRANDDPAGLIAAEQLRSELESLEAADRVSSRATAAATTADVGLAQVSSLLNTVRDRVVESAGGSLSPEEFAANQLEIDAALEAIDRIGAYTGLSDGGTIRVAPTGDANEVVGLGLPELSASALGGDAGRLTELARGGAASLSSGNYSRAVEILDGARNQVLSARARIGAFERYTIDASRDYVASARANLSEALSAIEDTDVAVAASQLVRGQILGQAAIGALRAVNFRRSLLLGLLEQPR